MKNYGKFYQTKEFEALNSEWYTRLKDEGFDDLEEANIEYAELAPSVDIYNARFKTREETERYFDLAIEYLSNGKFNTPIEKEVWEHHCDGDTMTEIARKIGKHKGTVQYHIRRTRRRANLSKPGSKSG